jgi:large subunit ribosomal protein L3
LKLVQKALLGRKLGMTQLFADDGRAVPVTVIAAGPCVVVQRKTAAREGYDALQLGYEEVPQPGRLNKPRAGHFRTAAEKAGKEISPCRHLVEFRFADCDAHQVGDRIGVDVFQVGERVDVTGTSKGKGFAGVQKRHGFRGGPASHGSMSHRRPASGGATDAARVFKGRKKPGRMGNVRTTVKRLRVHMVDAEKELLAVEGAIPGPTGRLVLVCSPAAPGGSASPTAEEGS